MSPSGLSDQDSARLGASVWPGMGFTRASWRAYKNMNGVIMPGVSAGSNQVGDKVTCTPTVNCPLGWAVACATRQGQSVSPAAPPRAPCRNRRLVQVLP